VLSVAKLTLGQEAYYEQQVVRGLDDYYAGRGESPGVWAGRGAAELELSGVVGDGDLGTLLRGIDPATGKQLRKPVRERTIRVRALDETGKWVEDWKPLKPLSGYDLVFSCPKSVSLLHALTDDERVRREISEAHETSWQASLAYLEREACVVRRGKGGKLREHGQGFVAAAFRHRTSRAQDPHLHTHVVVANMTQAEDGTWLALDGEAILKTYRLAAGYLYEANLRHELTRRLGVSWTEPVKGMAEFERVPEEAIRAFSRRRQSLVEHMEAMGTDGFAASRMAALATREQKEQVDLPRLREEWKARAAEHGLDRSELKRLVRDRLPGNDPTIDRDELAARLFGPDDGLTAKQTAFSMPELVCAVAGSLREGASDDHVLEEAEALSRHPVLEPLEQDEAPGRPARFTTRELLQVERRAIGFAIGGGEADSPCPDRTILARRLMESGGELTVDQRMLVHEASWRPGRVLCIAGAAGTGKTTALRLVADAYRESETPLLGAAPSGRAADELQTATGVPSSTLHRLLLDAHREDGLPHGCVLFVDEAGMAETRILAPVLELVAEAEGRAILVGDPHQLPPVGAGGLFPALCERLGAIDLTDNRRQRDLTERRALARLRDGYPHPYLAHAARRGRLHLEHDPTDAKQRLLEDWWQAAQHDLPGSVMLAHRRADVRDLNEAARTILTRAGRLGPDTLEAGERAFRVGDRVLCRRNDRTLGVRNGTRGTVVDLEPSALTLRTDSGQLRSLPLPYAAADLDHAYALTGHAAQGATVEHAFVLLPDHGALREWGYVACSRARAETHMYLAERDAIEHEETPLREPNTPGPPERAARALGRSASEPLALDQSRDRHDSATRSIAQQQEHLDQLRDETVERLAAAQGELGRLHWWKRDSRAQLEAQIGRDQLALERSDQKREQLRERGRRRSRVLALAHERDELIPPLRPEPPRPRLEREPPGLGLEL
jgi:conjugative relaxase-like TrwC/TraI family protein